MNRLWTCLLCVWGLAAGVRADSITFTERYTERLEAYTADWGGTEWGVFPWGTATLNATVRIEGLGQTYFEEWDTLLVALGEQEVQFEFGEAEEGSTQSRAVFLLWSEWGDVAGRLVVSRSGDVATIQVTYSDYYFSVVAQDHNESAGPFRDNGEGVTFRLQVSGFEEISRRLYYSGSTSIALRQFGGEFLELATVTASGAADFTPPRVTLLSPAPNSVYSGGDNEVQALIQATDNGWVQSVDARLNGEWLESATQVDANLWVVTLALAPGVNTLELYAEDADGNESATSLHRFRYVVKLPLTLNYDAAAGKVVGARNGQPWEIGQPCRLTAQPAPNHLFREWSMASDDSPLTVITNPVLTFLMETGQVVEATFVTNVFLGIQGTYHGLFSPLSEDTTEVKVENSGAIRLTLTAQRRFTGQLQLAGVTYPFAGGVNFDGGSTVLIRPANQLPITVDLQFDVDDDGENTGVTGTVSRWGWQASLRAVPAATGTQLRELAGKYTFLIPGGAVESAGMEPAGHGTLTATLTAAGALNIVGALGDGTPLTGSLPMSPSMEVPVYRALYGGKGLLGGWTRFSPETRQFDYHDLKWIRPAGVPRNPVYPDGFDWWVSLIGWPYVAPLGGTNALGWSTTNGTVLLEGGNLETPITAQISLVGNRLTVLDGNPHRLVLTLAPATGTVTGSFPHPLTGLSTPIKGALFQTESGFAAGWFRGTTQTGSFRLDPW